MKTLPLKPTGKPISINLPHTTENAVRKEARTEGLSISAVIRRVLMRHYGAQSGG